MEEKTIGMIIMPDGKTLTFDECLDNLKHTRDFSLYLDMLNVFKDRYLIILSIKDTPGDKISETSIQKIKKLGFTDYTTALHMMYIGIANKGNVVFNRVSDDQVTPVYFDGTVENVHLSVSSKSWRCGNTAEIIINGDNWSLNERGLNFVVYDCEKSIIEDVSIYDAFAEKPTFFHRNFYFSDQYINNHIYMPKKYIEHVTLHTKRRYFSNRKLAVQEIKRGIFLPNKDIDGKIYGGICDENFNFISAHQLFWPRQRSFRHIYGSYTVQQEEIDYVDEVVVYGGTMINHPGHLIIECFADRTWWFVKNADSNLKIAIATIWETSIWTNEYAFFVKEFLYAFGISEDRVIFIRKPTQFKKVIVPDQSTIPLWWTYPYEFTAEYIQVFQHIKERLIPGKYKKIYLTKKQTARQNIVGEDYFINFYRERGFEIICPEEYTIKEKAEILYGADEVVTVDGTNAQFAIFCKPTAKLTILSRLRNYWASLQQLVTEAAGIKDFYLVNVSGNFIHDDFGLGLTLLCVTDEFKKYVKEFFGEEIDITPNESLKNVLFDYLKFVPEYYSYPEYFNAIKNQKMLTVLQNMSELLLGKDFDTSNLDLSTNESNLQRQVQDLNAQKNSLTSQVNALNEENKGLKSAKAQNEDEIAKLRSDQNKLNSELLDAHRQKDEADKKFVELYQLKDEVYQKLLDTYQENDDTVKKLLTATEEKTNLVADISVKNHQIDILISEKDKLTANVLTKESELLIATDKVQSLESKLAVANKNVQSLESELVTANGKAQTFESELKNTRSKVQSLESELTTANKKLQSSEQECAELKNKINWMENTRSWRYTKPFRKKKKET